MLVWQGISGILPLLCGLSTMADSPENVDYEFVIPEDYDFSKSTEENYRAECPVFKGKYKHHRKVLDYSYHSHYTASRQRLHDQLIDRFHATRVHDEKRNAFCEAPLQNWIVFTAGPMGAGKSHTINWLNTQKIFPLDAFVRVDPDQIRELLPETKQYNQLDCSQTGFLTQREVGYISEVRLVISYISSSFSFAYICNLIHSFHSFLTLLFFMSVNRRCSQ